MKNTSKNKKSINFYSGQTGFLFFFGNSPDLAKIEVEYAAARLLPFLHYDSMITRQVAMFNTEKAMGGIGRMGISGRENIEKDLSNVQKLLGGTIKTAKILAELPNLDFLVNKITELLNKIAIAKSIKKINFAISDYSEYKINILRLSQDIKNSLKNDHFNCRFILPKDKNILSTAEIFHNHLDIWPNAEFNIVPFDNSFLLAQTVSVQNPNDWSKRDFGIPSPDAQSGMLPPKLARMMLNLRTRNTGEKRDTREIIYDPFCGNGRILLEAAYLGLDFLGSDINEVKVESTKKNLRWLRDQYQLNITNEEIEKRIFVADAQKWNIEFGISNIVNNPTFDIQHFTSQIVTEPDLGPALHYLSNISQAQTIADNLFNLYIKSIENLITPTIFGIFVIPAWKTKEGQIIKLSKKILDKNINSSYHLNKLGEYARPNSFILREIYYIKNSKS